MLRNRKMQVAIPNETFATKILSALCCKRSEKEMNKKLFASGECCKKSDMFCQNYGGTDYRNGCGNLFCKSHGFCCPLCKHGLCQECVDRGHEEDLLKCCNFAKKNPICPSCVFKCVECGKGGLCGLHRACVIMVDELSNEESGSIDEDYEFNNGHGLCMTCAYDSSVTEKTK